MSRHHLPQGKVWMLQLLSVACMSLAAKMEETEVPILLDLQVEDVEHIFEAHTIQRMELLVLSTLDWRMSSVTPFSYIDYYFHKLGISNVLLRALLSRVSEIILATLRETAFLVYRPSVVAAAATICSLEEVTALQAADLHQLFVDLSIDMDALKKCYQDMQDHVVDSNCQQQLPSKRKGFWCTSEPLSPVGVLEAAAAFSRTGMTGSCHESSLDVSLVVTPTTAYKRRKLDDFCSSNAWL
jgi:cyclin D1/2/4